MDSGILPILRDWGTRDLKSRIVETLLRDAADEIERLRDENTVLRKAVGDEGRANRMTLLYESAQTEIEQLRVAGERLSDALYMYSIGTPEFCDSTKILLAQWEEARHD